MKAKIHNSAVFFCFFLLLFAISEVTAIPVAEQTLNEAVHKSFLRITSDSPQTTSGFDYSQLETLYENVYNHPIACFDALQKYDPQGNIGFCFGRAMAVQLLARKMGLKKECQARVFAIGALGQDPKNPDWRFHTSAMVKDEKGEWYTIDPVMGCPMTLKQWIEKEQGEDDPERKAKFYITTADCVIPDIRIFPAVSKETGEGIIEISFNPKDHEGFTLRPELNPAAYELSAAACEKYFLTATEAPAERFDFLKLVCNDIEVSYNGYFVDLVKSIEQSVPGHLTIALHAAHVTNSPKLNRNIYGNGSIRFNALLNK
ncbi:MAG: hypothetical protein HQM08_05935 [Candidatus Riflebacteria bacterium]|nr:hypothetical protein [Candidatus Riflebacteria bacterium]